MSLGTWNRHPASVQLPSGTLSSDHTNVVPVKQSFGWLTMTKTRKIDKSFSDSLTTNIINAIVNKENILGKL